MENHKLFVNSLSINSWLDWPPLFGSTGVTRTFGKVWTCDDLERIKDQEFSENEWYRDVKPATNFDLFISHLPKKEWCTIVHQGGKLMVSSYMFPYITFLLEEDRTLTCFFRANRLVNLQAVHEWQHLYRILTNGNEIEFIGVPDHPDKVTI